MIRLMATGAVIALALVQPAQAEWILRKRPSILVESVPVVGSTASTVAISAPAETKAELVLQCFRTGLYSGIAFGISVHPAPAAGSVSWIYRFDDGISMQSLPNRTRTLPASSIVFGEAKSDEIRQLRLSKKLHLTLVSGNRPTLNFEFNVSGADVAIDKIGCKERNQLR